MAKKAEGAKKKTPKRPDEKPLSTGDLAEALKLVLPVILKNVQAKEIRADDVILLIAVRDHFEAEGDPLSRYFATRIEGLLDRLHARTGPAEMERAMVDAT